MASIAKEKAASYEHDVSASVAARGKFHVPRLRWLIAVMLLLASVMNYVDRQALSILAATIQKELNISTMGYAYVGQAFLTAYTLAYLLSGRIVDRFGPRVAQTLFIVWWSIANMLTGFATGLLSLIFFRSMLGLGEPGNYTAAAKSVAQWFPAREKGVAVGMYTMGGTLGAALAAPLIAFLTIRYGWRASFFATGILGLIVAALWFIIYRRPSEHPWLGAKERQYLAEQGVLEEKKGGQAAIRFRELLKLKAAWLVMLVRMITDPLWYFYLLWFAKYMQDERGFTLADVGSTLWIVFVTADIGCLLGGWLPGYFIRRGNSPIHARLKVMGGAATVLAFSAVVPWVPGRIFPLLLASLFTCAALAWITNCVTLPIDVFPASAVGSVQGLIGTGGSLGGAISTGIIGYLVTHFSYTPVFTMMSFLHPLAFLMIAMLLPSTVAAYRSQRALSDPVTTGRSRSST